MPLSNKSNTDNISPSFSLDRADSANMESISVNLIEIAAFRFNYKQNRVIIGTAIFNKIKHKFQKWSQNIPYLISQMGQIKDNK